MPKVPTFDGRGGQLHVNRGGETFVGDSCWLAHGSLVVHSHSFIPFHFGAVTPSSFQKPPLQTGAFVVLNF